MIYKLKTISLVDETINKYLCYFYIKGCEDVYLVINDGTRCSSVLKDIVGIDKNYRMCLKLPKYIKI